MSLLTTPSLRGRTRFPGNYRIDWMHPLTADLAGCWLPGRGLVYNLVNGRVATRHGTGIENIGKFGPQYNPNNAGAADTNWIVVKNGPILAGSARFSLVAFSNPTFIGGGFDFSLYSERASTGNDLLKMNIGSGGGNNAMTFTYRNDGGTLLQLNNFGNNCTNAYHVFGISKNGGVTNGTQVFYDGVSQAQATWSSNDTLTDAVVSSIGDDSAGAFTSGYAGPILFLALWKRSLSTTEHLSMSNDPFQFLLPDESEMPAISSTLVKFRRTLSGIGTRTGSHQAVMQ